MLAFEIALPRHLFPRFFRWRRNTIVWYLYATMLTQANTESTVFKYRTYYSAE